MVVISQVGQRDVSFACCLGDGSGKGKSGVRSEPLGSVFENGFSKYLVGPAGDP
jgi:hypothetical protein